MIQLRVPRAFCALLFAALAGACGDDLPTSTGPERFPVEARLTSFALDLETDEFLEPFGYFDGYSSRFNIPFLIAANQFDGGLNSRILMRTVSWPGAVLGDSSFTHVQGRMLMTVDTLGSSSDGTMLLRMYELTQPWHENSVSWEMAVDTAGGETQWTTPGGSLGRFVSSAVWTASQEDPDTISFPLDSLSLANMSAPDFPGVAVVAEGVAGRLQALGFEVQSQVRLSTRPDTLHEQVIPGGQGAFIFDSPAPPPLEPGWLIGGLTSGRALFRITLPDSVPICRTPTPACPRVPLSGVNLNDVSLMLTPMQVGGGFGEVSPVTIRLRLVGSPELGRIAPLGPVPLATPGLLTQVQTRPNLFRQPPADTAIAMILTEEAVRRVTGANGAPVAFSLALLAEPEGGFFGYARFRAEPRLRIVYTLPQQQTAP